MHILILHLIQLDYPERNTWGKNRKGDRKIVKNFSMKISEKQKRLHMLLHVWSHNNERRKCGYTDNLVELSIYHNEGMLCHAYNEHRN